MKKALMVIGGILVIALITAYIFRQELMIGLMAGQIAPEHDFDATLAPPAPDYTQADWWAARPDMDDPSDEMPIGATADPQGVAVFFVHPTSYFGKDNWNQPLDAESANFIVDENLMRHQASVFNGCCDVYAPRYRQATFFSFMDQDGNGEQALTLAYQDVVSAFQQFIAEIGPDQPFILAGHSQGSRHSTLLLAEHIDGTPLLDRMVAAYLIGFGVTDSQIGSVPICASADQTGCAIGWNVMDGPGTGAFGGNDGLICVNPLNWQNDLSYAAHELNTGAIGFADYANPDPEQILSTVEVEVAIADAQCQEDGQLAVMELRSESFPGRMFGNSMHPYDYSLFHSNLRANATTRIAAFAGGAE